MTSAYCPQISLSGWSEPDVDQAWVEEATGRRGSTRPEKVLAIDEAIRRALSAQGPSLEQELEILRENREDEWDTPTDFAYAFATLVVAKFKSRNPVPFLTTDDRGGIRMIWRFGRGQVIANFGAAPDARSYLYYESENEHGTEPLEAERLTDRLRWLGQ